MSTLCCLAGEDPAVVVTDAAVHTLYREANKFALVSLSVLSLSCTAEEPICDWVWYDLCKKEHHTVT